MAKRIRTAPSVSENKDFRARESFDAEVEGMLKMVGEATVDVASIAAGAVGTVVITVPGAKMDMGQTVQVGLPSVLNNGLVAWGNITADGAVTITLYNRTGSAIDPASGKYSARVMP